MLSRVFMKEDFAFARAAPTQVRVWIFWIARWLRDARLFHFAADCPRSGGETISKQLDREVSIQKIKINPFVLSTTIRGLLIKDKDGQPFVSWDEVYVNFQLSSFFGQAWVFKEISTTKPFVRAQMNKDGTFNFSDLVAKFSTNTAPAANRIAIQTARPACRKTAHRGRDGGARGFHAARTVPTHGRPARHHAR
jgi:hypothetical protein